MSVETVVSRPFWPFAFLWAGLFAVAHTQAPEFYSNQHQYFLHGYAEAGVGEGLLAEDWLANTADPTPAFTRFVAWTQTNLGTFAFQVAYFGLLGIYFEAVRQLIAALPGFPQRGPARAIFLTLFLAAHSAILRVASIQLAGVDYPWFLQAGLAAQYVLGPGLQPSSFGILLVVSLAAFAKGRTIVACILAGLAVAMHSTYILAAGFMTVGYLVASMREGQTIRGLIGGAFALAIVAPVVWYNYNAFTIDNHDRFIESQWILVNERIPHHAIVERWLDPLAGVQIAVMFLAIYFARNSRLFPVLAITTSACTVLTIVQVIVESPVLALFFPWRFSAVLMPISTAIVFGKLAMFLGRRIEDRPSTTPILLGCGVLTTALVLGGIAVAVFRLGYHTNDAELPMLEFVRANKKAGDVYLLPAKLPTLKKESPASQSKTFAPPVRPGAVGIPVDLQRFRLSTGAPIYIDFKSPPYAADEVFEWQRRIKECERWFAQRDWDNPEIWREVHFAGITHVVTTADRDISSRQLERVFKDETYRVYRVRRE